MKLTVLGSSSSGNCYLLEGSKESLILELGIRFADIKKALNFDMSKVKGCLVSHRHGDHYKAVNDAMGNSLEVYASQGTFQDDSTHHRANVVKSLESFTVGGFTIKPFDTQHDCYEPLGFLIQHDELGKMLFATDTYYIKYKFDKLDHIMVECNYSNEILDKWVHAGLVSKSREKRLRTSHMEIQNCKELVRVNNWHDLKTVVLLHLSDGNSDEALFKSEIETVTDAEVYVADKGLVVDLDKFEF